MRGTATSTMCVCGDMAQLAEHGQRNQFMPHNNQRTGEPCPGIPMETQMFGFGKALDVLRDGDAVTRTTWNAPGQFVILVPGSEIEIAADRPLGRACPERVGEYVQYRDHIDIFTANGEVVTWQPTISDVLAEDWDYVQ